MNNGNKFSIENDDFLKKINHADAAFVALVPPSTGYISAGDILKFNYVYFKSNMPVTDSPTVLVVSIDRGNGLFLSTQNNMLISCFKIDDVSESVLKIVINAIYKDRGLANYRVIKKALSSIFGSWNFRTYKVSNLSGLNKIQIDRRRLKDSEEL
jgi:hypothetical protein